MAGNVVGDNSGSIYAEAFDNIIVVDPNKVVRAGVNGQTVIEERLVDHENLVMYANLECELLPRTRLNVGASPTTQVETISIASINFLKPNNDQFMNTGYYDDLTGLNSNEGKARLQRSEEVVEEYGRKIYRGSTVTDKNGKTIDPGLLGITNITVRTSTSFIPEVSIEFEDIQGKALFEQGEQSPYAAFFHLPYPPFYLTLKGYYGQAVKYQLNLHTFNARFNSFSGNYQITCTFFGYKYNILNEIQLGHLIALPHMYSKTFTYTSSLVETESADDNSANNAGQNIPSNAQSQNNVSVQRVNEKGRQKIHEVYSEYKSKGIIDKNFPELTLMEMAYKLQQFEQNIVSSYKKVDLQPITDATSYKKTLDQYYKAVRDVNNSWSTTFLDPKPFVLKDGQYAYLFKRNITESQRVTAQSELAAITLTFNGKLAQNATFGAEAKQNYKIPNPITPTTYIENLNLDNVDWEKTFIERTSIKYPTQEQISKYIVQSVKDYFGVKVEYTPAEGLKEVKSNFYVFVGNNRFDTIIKSMQSQIDAKVNELETKLSAELADKVERADTGIGFKPTVKNVSAVIMASTEAFIRLLDDVHLQAYSVREDPVRQSVILGNNSTSVKNPDDVNYVPLTANASQEFRDNSRQPTYPWPQVFVENNANDDNQPRYTLTYPGDPDFVNISKGFLYDKWPEVEFVEEYLKGTAQRIDPSFSQPPSDNEAAVVKRLNINAIEFPNIGLAYLNKEELKYFYEIYERQLIYQFYTGFGRVIPGETRTTITELVGDTESNNIIESLGISNPYLIQKLKEYPFTATDYTRTLEAFSNQGTGLFWGEYIQDIYITPYLKNYTENPFSVLNLKYLSNSVSNSFVSLPNVPKLELFLKSSSTNPLQIVDTFPFTYNDWNVKNLSNYLLGSDPQLANNTTNTYKVYAPKNIIANFSNVDDRTTNRPVTNFNYLSTNIPALTTNVNAFYLTRQASDLLPTEGFIKQYGFQGLSLTTNRTTTSMLNTPYFVNAILEGVAKEKNKELYPYVAAAYLFLNSLPLATFKDRYKTLLTGNVSQPLDYIFASFKKFGALHKVPYVWILKYGSIWHRYKKQLESNQDIISGCWGNFDYKQNYDPINQNSGKTYTLNGTGQITLQTETVDNGIKYTNMQVGFYPKLINDFNYFYNSRDLYTAYTDGEINESIKNGLKIQNLSESNIFKNTTKDLQVRVVDIKTYSVLLPNNITPSVPNTLVCNEPPTVPTYQYYVIPSFGSQLNEVNTECFNSVGLLTEELYNNEALFNGTVRAFWRLPNYGYYENQGIKKPNIQSYMLDELNLGGNVPFELIRSNDPTLSSQYDYSKIDDMFSVFDKEVLDILETEFLNFSKALTNFNTAEENGNVIDPAANASVNGGFDQYSDLDVTYRNFQKLMRSLMTVQIPLSSATSESLFEEIIDSQYSTFIGEIQNLMEYDVVLRMGNPTRYKRRVVDSYIGYITNTSQVINPIVFGSYQGNLPTGGTVTLGSSITSAPDEWRTLQLEVGFSTISELVYKDSGSYITDFFVQSNIAFTSANISELTPIIRMYATQRLQNPNLTITDFVGQLQGYLNTYNAFKNTCLDDTLARTRKGLPQITELPEKTIQSKFNSKQAKVDLYEAFKALNDKWIAGTDYKRYTLFEDMLFLDRASRNIGDKVVVDIFKLKQVISEETINLNMGVFTFLAGILTENHFTIMPMPAYVNFYNVQEASSNAVPSIPNTTDFANEMWGTYLTVDYRKSGPKLVCFYANRPSSYVDVADKSNKNYLFRTDTFDIRNPVGNPNVENQTNKTDWAQSNMCVGFSVDIGTRNQNIFYSFSVSQENGKSTAESVYTLNNMANAASGRDTATQNNSLYNIYQNRSYQCEVVAFGNALIQPTMYFQLRHVPLFNGSYLITDVEHTIQPGSFQTKFTGVRQSVLSYPYTDNLLQSINQNLVGKLISAVSQRKDDPAAGKSTTTQGNNANSSTNSNTQQAPQNSCDSEVLEVPYKQGGYTSSAGTIINLPAKQLYDLLIQNVNTDSTDPDDIILYQNLRYIIFLISWAASGNGSNNNFVGINNNFGRITLNYNYGELRRYFEPVYSCQDIVNEKGLPLSYPVVHFTTPVEYLLFMKDKLINRVADIQNKSIETFYLQSWPQNRNVSQTTNSQLATNLQAGDKIAKNLGLNSTVPAVKPTPTPTPTANSQNIIINITPTCPTPTPSAT